MQFAGLGSAGLFMSNGPPNLDSYGKFPRIESGKVFAYSNSGTLLAWADGTGVKVMSLPDCVSQKTIDAPKASALRFSPLGNYLATWQLYTTANSQGNPDCNLHIFETQTGKCVKSFHQKRQSGWEPQWTDDEKVVARNVNNEIHFYENNNYDVIVKKIFLQKISEFSLSTGRPPYHTMCYVQGSKGQPSSIRLFEYPHFEGNSAIKALKSFFKADQVTMQWNKKGNAVLALTVTDVDKSGASYYGEQKLYLLNTSGDSMYVQLAKEGPIYSYEWSPLSKEFCVVYGYMPAKATLYNLKADPIFDFGTSPRNLAYYNPFGNMLILAGFGNLNGHLEVWDLPKKKEIVRTNARDTTFLQWGPDGEHILTATLSPRLRVGNGYRIWHYTGSLIHELFIPSGEELRQIQWRPAAPGTFVEKPIKYSSVPSIASAQPQASKEAYRPPAARGLSNMLTKLHEDFEKPSNAVSTEAATKNALKNRKRRAKKAEALAAGETSTTPPPPTNQPPVVTEVKKKVSNENAPPQTKNKAPVVNKNKDKVIASENVPPSTTTPAPAGKKNKNQNKSENVVPPAPSTDAAPTNKKKAKASGENAPPPAKEAPAGGKNKNQNKAAGENQAPPVAKTQEPAGGKKKNPQNKVAANDNNQAPPVTKSQEPAGSKKKNQNKDGVKESPQTTDKKTAAAGGPASGEGHKNSGNLAKKLREIQVLKERQAKGEKLLDMQIEKIGREEEIKRDLMNCQPKSG